MLTRRSIDAPGGSLCTTPDDAATSSCGGVASCARVRRGAPPWPTRAARPRQSLRREGARAPTEAGRSATSARSTTRPTAARRGRRATAAPRLPLFGVDFADAQHGWAVGKSALDPAHRRRRQDAGSRRRARSRPSKHLFKVTAVDARTAWAVGDWGAIARHPRRRRDLGGPLARRLTVQTRTARSQDDHLPTTSSSTTSPSRSAARLHRRRVRHGARHQPTAASTWTQARRSAPRRRSSASHFIDAASAAGWSASTASSCAPTDGGHDLGGAARATPRPRRSRRSASSSAQEPGPLRGAASSGERGVVVGDIGHGPHVSADGGETWTRRELPEKRAPRLDARREPRAGRRAASSSAPSGFAARVDGGRGRPARRRQAASADALTRTEDRMLSRKTIEAYLFFLLRHQHRRVAGRRRASPSCLACFMWHADARLHQLLRPLPAEPSVHPALPEVPQHVRHREHVLMVVEVKNGTIFDDPTTVQKVDRITLELLHNIPGVNGEQVHVDHAPEAEDDAHRRARASRSCRSPIRACRRTRRTSSSCARRSTRPRACAACSSRDDDKATLIIAGFWEEYFDLAGDVEEDPGDRRARGGRRQHQDLRHRPADPLRLLHRAHAADGRACSAPSIAMILLILWFEFRSWQGVVIPAFAARCSAPSGGSASAALCGFTLDPLVLVDLRCSSRRARTRTRCSRWSATTRSTTGCSDKDRRSSSRTSRSTRRRWCRSSPTALAILTLPWRASRSSRSSPSCARFWIISIFVSVVTLHPIILSFTPPPRSTSGTDALERFMSWMMLARSRGSSGSTAHPGTCRACSRSRCSARRATCSGSTLPATAGRHAISRSPTLRRVLRRVYLRSSASSSGSRGLAALAMAVALSCCSASALLPAPAEGRRHHARRGAALRRPPVQRRLPQGEREVRRREPAGHHRRGHGVLHDERQAVRGRRLQALLPEDEGLRQPRSA